MWMLLLDMGIAWPVSWSQEQPTDKPRGDVVMVTAKIEAQAIREGDFLPGLDNGYVIDVECNPDIRDEYNIGLGRGMVAITFNTATGDEGFLVAPPDTPVTVEREADEA